MPDSPAPTGRPAPQPLSRRRIVDIVAAAALLSVQCLAAGYVVAAVALAAIILALREIGVSVLELFCTDGCPSHTAGSTIAQVAIWPAATVLLPLAFSIGGVIVAALRDRPLWPWPALGATALAVAAQLP